MISSSRAARRANWRITADGAILVKKMLKNLRNCRERPYTLSDLYVWIANILQSGKGRTRAQDGQKNAGKFEERTTSNIEVPVRLVRLNTEYLQFFIPIQTMNEKQTSSYWTHHIRLITARLWHLKAFQKKVFTGICDGTRPALLLSSYKL